MPSAYRRARSVARRLSWTLASIRARQVARRILDFMRLGTGTAERLVTALILSALVFFALLIVSHFTKVGTQSGLMLAGGAFGFVFLPFVVLTLWSSDESLVSARGRVEAELLDARQWVEAEADAEDERRRREDDEDREWEESQRRRERRRADRGPRYRCPFCGTGQPPYVIWRTSTAGWVMFCVVLFVAILGMFFCCCVGGLLLIPFSFLGLMIREPYHVCGSCGVRIG